MAKPIPDGYRTVTATLNVKDCDQFIDFIKTQSDRSFCVPNNAATPSR